MRDELQRRVNWCNCLIMSAAICDFRPKKVAKKKIKRSRKKRIILELKQNPDILGMLAFKKGKKTLVGFALETENLKKNAEDKLRQKNLDLIVATQIKANSYPFGRRRLDVLIMNRKGQMQRAKKMSKTALARILLDNIEKIVLR